jgi:hypothetical protein
MDKFLVLLVVLVILLLFEWWVYERYVSVNTLTESQKNNARTIFCIVMIMSIGFAILIYMYGDKNRQEYGLFGRKKEVQKVPEVRAYPGNPMKKQDYTTKGLKVEPKTDNSKIGILKGTKK